MDQDAVLAAGRPRPAEAVAEAVAVAFDSTAGLPPERAFVALAWELELRGLQPDPAVIFDAAHLISRGVRPTTMWVPSAGRRRRSLPADTEWPRRA